MNKLTDENINTILDNITPEIGTILADKLRGAFQNQADELKGLREALQNIVRLYDDEASSSYQAQAAYDMRCVALTATEVKDG